jgi:hypothetical protein
MPVIVVSEMTVAGHLNSTALFGSATMSPISGQGVLGKDATRLKYPVLQAGLLNALHLPLLSQLP